MNGQPVKYAVRILLWSIAAAYTVYSAVRAHAHRKTLAVQRIEIEVSDSSARGHLVTGPMIRGWIDRSGLKCIGEPVSDVPLREIRQLIARNGFVRSVSVGIDYEGTMHIEVSQRRPALRLLLNGYNAYATADGYVFTAPPRSALYVPVLTGSYRPPFPPGYSGSLETFLQTGEKAILERIESIEREKYPLYRNELENDEDLREARRMSVRKGWLQSKESYRREVAELREKKTELYRLYRYRDRMIQQKIDKITLRQDAERNEQKKLRKSCEDFLKLVNFVGIIEKDDFWRSEIVQIVVTTGSSGAPEIELVPRAGDHTILFGPPDDIDEKFDRLERFYRKGLRHIGWDTYRTISVKYKGQVVCTK